MPRDVVSELAPTGVLRAAINMGNFLLVTGRTPSGDPEGVAPDMAREIASRLGVPVAYVPYARPGELADTRTHDAHRNGQTRHTRVRRSRRVLHDHRRDPADDVVGR